MSFGTDRTAGMMITEAEDFFAKGCGRCARFDTPDCSTKAWAEGLAELRRQCLAAGLVETVKWGHPTYMHAGRNIALIGAFRGDFRLNFFDAPLLTDPEGILGRSPAGKPDGVRFDDPAAPARMAGTIAALLAEAKAHAEAGRRAPRDTSELVLPDELVAALDADPALAEAFAALTPGRKKSYVLNLEVAKKPETRIARIEKFRPLILAGKGALER